MRRDWTTCSKPKMSIMDLPYKTHDELSKILDPDGAKSWKQLVSLMTVYTAKDVKMIETEGSKPGMSCTLQLLQDMDNRDYTVHELKYIIKLSGNEKALRCLLDGLDDESLIQEDAIHEDTIHEDTTHEDTTHEDTIHEDTITCLKRKRYTRSPQELEEPSNLHTMKRHKTKIQDMRHNEGTENSQTHMSGTRETLMKDRPIHQPPGDIGLCNPESGTGGTLRMEGSIQQPSGDTDLRSSEPVTRETSRMDHPIQQPSGDTDLRSPEPVTRETSRMDHPLLQPSGDIGLRSPEPGTKETSRIDHPTHQNSSERIELHFPIQDTIGFKKDLHKRCNIENLPSENDETQYHDVHDNKFARAPMPCLSASSGQRLPTEHEDNKQELVATWSPASIPRLFMWMISCGSQGEAI